MSTFIWVLFCLLSFIVIGIDDNKANEKTNIDQNEVQHTSPSPSSH